MIRGRHHTGAQMSEKRRRAGHHASAAYHHGQAAHYHREASHHYQIGKNFAHAAHLAAAAYEHAASAIWYGKEVQAHDENLRAHAPEYPSYFTEDGLDTATTSETLTRKAAQHAAAADDHDEAAQHHSRAAELLDEKDRS